MADPQNPAAEAVRVDLSSLRQSATAAPVVTDARLPAMEKVGDVKTVVHASGLPLMGAGPVTGAGAGQAVMAEVPQRVPAPSPPDRTLQQAKQSQTDGPSDGYVRLEIHVENGQLSVTGMHEVQGPLALPTTMTRGYAYEVLLNDTQIALGSVPDAGVRRAFANQDVPGPEGKHRFIADPSFEFFVRIPKTHLSATTLPQLTVVLHKVQDAPDRLVRSAPLLKQSGVVTTEVGRLSGIKVAVLPEAVRVQIERILTQSR